MKESEIMADRFALNIRAIRHQRGLSPKEASAITHISTAKLSSIERGAQKISLIDALDICKSFEADLMTMLSEDLHDPGRYL